MSPEDIAKEATSETLETEVIEEIIEIQEINPNAWIWGTGRRKTSVARVRIRPGTGNVMVNGKKLDDFFCVLRSRRRAIEPIVTAQLDGKFDIHATCHGGGTTGQADAMLMGLARCLVKMDEKLQPLMRASGYLTRDDRMVERKKYGLAGARRSYQYSKR